jgi:WD40 repeat protein
MPQEQPINSGPAQPVRAQTGGVTLLFTDIVSSTASKQRLGDQAGAALIQQQRALLRELHAEGARQSVPCGFLMQGKSLVTVDRVDGVIREWDLSAGLMKRSWPSGGKPGAFVAAAFSRDERWFLHLSYSGASHRIDLTSGREDEPNISLRQAVGAAFSPDDRFFAAVSQKGATKIWEASTLRPVDVLGGFLQGTHSLAWSPNSRRLVIGSDGDEAIKVWDVESRQELVTLSGEGYLFYRTAFSPDGNVLGAMSRQGTLHLWRAPSWAEIEASEKKQREEARTQ